MIADNEMDPNALIKYGSFNLISKIEVEFEKASQYMKFMMQETGA